MHTNAGSRGRTSRVSQSVPVPYVLQLCLHFHVPQATRKHSGCQQCSNALDISWWSSRCLCDDEGRVGVTVHKCHVAHLRNWLICATEYFRNESERRSCACRLRANQVDICSRACALLDGIRLVETEIMLAGAWWLAAFHDVVDLDNTQASSRLVGRSSRIDCTSLVHKT
jgi:hypothetical protein